LKFAKQMVAEENGPNNRYVMMEGIDIGKRGWG
jgi:hypothetical protein